MLANAAVALGCDEHILAVDSCFLQLLPKGMIRCTSKKALSRAMLTTRKALSNHASSTATDE